MRCDLLILASLPFIASCSIKEERIECPCEYTLDIVSCRPVIEVLNFSLWDGESKVISEYFFDEDLLESKSYQIERKRYVASLYTGDLNCLHDGHTLLLTKGCQADSIYAWSEPLDATGEYAGNSVILHKQFATVTFDLSEYDNPSAPLSGRVTGSYGGFDILGLKPVESDFLYEFRTDGSNLYPVRIPRQGDDSLSLEMYFDGRPYAKVDVGKLLASGGYDWTAPDLFDVTVDVSSSEIDAEVEISPWVDVPS